MFFFNNNNSCCCDRQATCVRCRPERECCCGMNDHRNCCCKRCHVEQCKQYNCCKCCRMRMNCNGGYYNN